MRIISSHQTALDRQVKESVGIREEARKEECCLNLKYEWAGSKIPFLSTNTPIGLAKDKTVKGAPYIRLETGNNTSSTKRLQYNCDEDQDIQQQQQYLDGPMEQQESIGSEDHLKPPDCSR